MNKQIFDNHLALEFHKKMTPNTKRYIKNIVYSVFYLLFLLYLIYITQWYKRITDKQQYDLMIHVSGVINSILGFISKVPLLRGHLRDFENQQNLNKSIIVEKYALYGTNIVYHFIQVFKKSDKDLGSKLYDVVSLVWSIQASPHSSLGKTMNRVTRRTNFIINLFGGNTRDNKMRKKIKEIHAAHVGFIMTCLQKLLLEGVITLTSKVANTKTLKQKNRRLLQQ